MVNEEGRRKINQWLCEIKNGNKDAARDLFLFLNVEIKQIARLYLNNNQNDEDVLSEVFARIGNSIQSYNTFKDGYTWMYAITKHTAFTCNETEKRFGTATDSEILENIPARHNPFDDVEMDMFLKDAMANMNEKDRLITTMLFIEDRPQTEIAEILHMSGAAVSQRKARILRYLAKFLKT